MNLPRNMMPPLKIKILLRWLVERGVVKINEGPPELDFDLRDVGRDPVYFDLRFANDLAPLSPGITPQIGKAFADCLDGLLARRHTPLTHIVGAPYGGDPFAEALAHMRGFAPTRLKKEKNGEITGFLTIPPPKRAKIVIVENVTASGQFLLKTARFIRAHDRSYRITAVLSCIDRDSGAKELLEHSALELMSVVSMKGALDFFIGDMAFPQEPCMRSREHAKRLAQSSFEALHKRS